MGEKNAQCRMHNSRAVETGTQPSSVAERMGTQPSSVAGNAALGTSAYPSSVAERMGTQPSSVAEISALGTSAYPSAYPIHDHCRKYLPHIENKQLQFITFRLYDSLPKDVIDTWKKQLDYDNIDIDEDTDDKTRQMLILIDKFEDAGYGQCFFNDVRVRNVMSSSLHYNDGKKYNLISYCIMPNHVHVLVEMYDGYGLSEIVSNWRSYTAHKANKILGSKGDFWMHEYFDRYIRNERHLIKTLNYIADNPIKAHLANSIDEWEGYYLLGTQPSSVAGNAALGGGTQPSSVAEHTAFGTSAYPISALETSAYPDAASRTARRQRETAN